MIDCTRDCLVVLAPAVLRGGGAVLPCSRLWGQNPKEGVWVPGCWWLFCEGVDGPAHRTPASHPRQLTRLPSQLTEGGAPKGANNPVHLLWSVPGSQSVVNRTMPSNRSQLSPRACRHPRRLRTKIPRWASGVAARMRPVMNPGHGKGPSNALIHNRPMPQHASCTRAHAVPSVDEPLARPPRHTMA